VAHRSTICSSVPTVSPGGDVPGGQVASASQVCSSMTVTILIGRPSAGAIDHEAERPDLVRTPGWDVTWHPHASPAPPTNKWRSHPGKEAPNGDLVAFLPGRLKTLERGIQPADPIYYELTTVTTGRDHRLHPRLT
jgi:hypothetical protein